MNTIITCSNLLGVVPWSRIFGGETPDFSHGQKEYPKWPAWCGSIPMFLSKGEPDHIVTLPGCCLRCLPRSPTTQVTQDPAANYASPETHAIQTTERDMWSSHWIFNVILKEHLQEIMDIFHGFPQLFPTKSGRFCRKMGNLSASRPWENLVATHPMEPRATLLLEITSQA